MSLRSLMYRFNPLHPNSSASSGFVSSHVNATRVAKVDTCLPGKVESAFGNMKHISCSSQAGSASVSERYTHSKGTRLRHMRPVRFNGNPGVECQMLVSSLSVFQSGKGNFYPALVARRGKVS